jgi:hypothetical protein
MVQTQQSLEVPNSIIHPARAQISLCHQFLLRAGDDERYTVVPALTKESMQQIPLIHPIYLDVPMLVSFAAAVQGGLSLASEVTEEKKRTACGSGSLSADFNLSSLFKSLFEAGTKANLEGSAANETQLVRKESRSYTEASIAIILYHQLKTHKGSILEVSSIKDITNLPIGALVEVPGRVEKNTIDSIIDYANAIDILSSMGDQEMPAANTQQKGRQGFSPASKKQKSDVARVAEFLDQDRKRTPISNVILRTEKPTELDVVISLKKDNLRDLTLSELHKNNVRVVGKITRLIPEGEEMISFENYGMAMLNRELLAGIFTGITSAEGFAGELSDFVVRGPAIQILPLMIFV